MHLVCTFPTQVPLGLIESVTVQQPTELQLYLKDGRVVR